MDPFLLSVQIFGYATNLYTQGQSNKMSGYQVDLDKRALDLQMQQNQLAATESSIASTQRLQDTLASQRALLAHRGQDPGQGTALSAQSKSISLQQSEESARKLALNYQQYQAQSKQRLLQADFYQKKAEKNIKNIESWFSNTSFNAFLAGR